MTGYFVGLALGAFAVAAWTLRYGGISRRAWHRMWREIANLRPRSRPVPFQSKRSSAASHPAE